MAETLAYTSGLTGQTITFGDGSLPFVFYSGLTGAGMAPVDNFVVDTAYQPGAQFVRTKKKTAVVTAHLVITGDPASADQRASMWSTLSTVLAVLEPSITTAGTLSRTDSAGTVRVLHNVQYVGGNEVSDQAENLAFVQIDLVFEAYDPTWYSVNQHGVSVGASSDPFGFPVPVTVPLVVSGQASGIAIVNNAGNIYARPVFTFTGPLQNYSITNQTTGESFAITQDLNAGDTLTVDTGAGTVMWTPAGGTAAPLYSSFSGSRQWVRLAPGSNTVQFKRDVAGAQQCTMSWYDTWNHG